MFRYFRFCLFTFFVSSLISACGSDDDTTAVVFAGTLEAIPESVGEWVWGDSKNALCQQWSIALYDTSGWFYGSRYPWSSADVFVLKAPADPLSVVAAENFDYTLGSVQAFEGDTVFFRGRNGFFGAWQIYEIDGRQDATLSGMWYFKSGGGGDFTQPIVPADEPIRDGDCSRT